MRYAEWVAPFLCFCVIWCPISWTWWAYWQAELLQHIQKHHAQFDRTVLWPRNGSFFLNLGRLYLFNFSKNNLGDERIAFLKRKTRPALIGFLGGQFFATAYTIGIILAVRVFHWL